MSVPEEIKITYPEKLDTDTNLFLVKDSLRLALLNDYNPNDKIIYANATPEDMALFPDSGIITLTEQCSDLEERAISFYYGSKDNNNQTFSNLQLLDNFPDVKKIAKATNITLNVVSQHHNNLKDALNASSISEDHQSSLCSLRNNRGSAIGNSSNSDFFNPSLFILQ